MKELLKQLIDIIKYKQSQDNVPRYIVWYNGCPIILNHNQLTSAINTSYICTHNEKYFELPKELHTIQMKRSKQKLEALQSINRNEENVKIG